MSPGSDARTVVEIDGHELSLSNLHKVLYPEVGVHQGRGDRLLPPDRTGDDPASRRAPDHAEALPQRRGRAILLREELPLPPTAVGRTIDIETRAGDPAATGGDDRTTARSTRPRTWSGRRTWRRSSSTRGCRPRRPRPPDGGGLRPRPRPGKRRGHLRGRWASSSARCSTICSLVVAGEELGVEGSPALRAAELARGELRRHAGFRPGARPAARTRASRPGHDEHGQGAPARPGLRRLEPEQLHQDDDRGVLAPGPAAPDCVHAAAWDEVDEAVADGAADRLRFDAADVLARVESDGRHLRPAALDHAAAAGVRRLTSRLVGCSAEAVGSRVPGRSGGQKSSALSSGNHPLARSIAWPTGRGRSAPAGSTTAAGRQAAATSSSPAQVPTASPARKAAPRVVASTTGETSTGRALASASAWTKVGLALMPPSIAQRRIDSAAVGLGRVDQVGARGGPRLRARPARSRPGPRPGSGRAACPGRRSPTAGVPSPSRAGTNHTSPVVVARAATRGSRPRWR